MNDEILMKEVRVGNKGGGEVLATVIVAFHASSSCPIFRKAAASESGRRLPVNFRTNVEREVTLGIVPDSSFFIDECLFE
jgi:hypothetical protein